MDRVTQQHLDNLHCNDTEQRYASFQYIIQLTQQPVDWAYDVWDDMLGLLKTGDNHQRAIAAQLLSNLAKRDPKKRMLKDLDQLLSVTKDKKFVTARHALQSLWKVGIVNKELQNKLIAGLSGRYEECIREKNCTLIRYDILEVFRKIYNEVHDDEIKNISHALIE